jgi:Domain of unknown function (DUF6438)
VASFKRYAVAAIVILFAVPAPAVAACGPGKTPTYADIQSVSYGRTGCFGRCAAYDVLFDDYEHCYYVGELYVAMPGTYEDACTSAVLKRAVAALRLHDFYGLNYDSRVLVLDVPHFIISVKRCGVTTKLDWPLFEDRNDIESLMDALDKITESIPWRKTSDSTAPDWIQ